MNMINLRKMLFQVFQSWNCNIMKNDSLSNGFRNIVQDPWMNKVVAAFPRTAIEISKIKNWCGSINESELVLRAKSALHGMIPCKVIGAIRFRRNGKRSWTLTRVNVKWWISVGRILARSHGKQRRNARKHKEKKKLRRKMQRKEKEEALVWSKEEEEEEQKLPREASTAEAR